MAQAIYKAKKVPSRVDWARLASFIDGEGHITIHQQVPRKHPRRVPNLFVYVSISNTDPRLMAWLQDHFGGAVNPMKNVPPGKNWKQPLHWTIGARQAVELLENCLEYFIIKREQAEVALAFQRTIGKHGQRVSPETVEVRLEFRKKLLSMTKRGKLEEPVTQTVQ